jgi:hypothetical protein
MTTVPRQLISGPSKSASKILAPDRRLGRPRDGLCVDPKLFELVGALIDLFDRHARVDCGQVQFINENGGGPGVRLRKRQQPK